MTDEACKDGFAATGTAFGLGFGATKLWPVVLPIFEVELDGGSGMARALVIVGPDACEYMSVSEYGGGGRKFASDIEEVRIVYSCYTRIEDK